MKILTNALQVLTGRPADKSDVANEAFGRGQTHRLAMAALTALVSTYWVGPYSAAGWLALVALQEWVILPLVMSRLVEPNITASPGAAKAWGAAITLWGASLYTFGWAPAYFSGRDGAGYFAGVWLACAIIHALVYSRRDRLLFAAHVVPALVAAFVGPFISHGFGLLAIVLAIATARLTLTTFIALSDRLALLATAKLNRAQRKAAEEASAAKSRFLATMSHELRTPLNAIIGYAEILEEDLDAANPAAAEDTRRIRRAAERLLGLINETLDLSKIEAGQVEISHEPADVGAIVDAVLEDVAHLAHRNRNKVSVRVVPSAKLFVGDGARVRQCVLNLVSNACKFTSDGEVCIEAAPYEKEGAQFLSITVSDTGIGVPADQLSRIFEPFAQGDDSTTRNYEGTGLGLAITRKLARLMGGDVSVASAPGKGSRFRLLLAMRSDIAKPTLDFQTIGDERRVA